jgi:hypothetical protein
MSYPPSSVSEGSSSALIVSSGCCSYHRARDVLVPHLILLALRLPGVHEIVVTLALGLQGFALLDQKLDA